MNYFPQADPSGNCCDCPDRADPCDDCAGCALPEGDCPHAICVEFKLDGGDTPDASNRDIVELSGPGAGWGFYFDGADWQFYGFADGAEAITAVDPFDTWHRLVVQMTSTGTSTLHVEWSVDGVDGTPLDITWNSCAMAQSLIIGAFSGSGDAHRTIRKVDLKGNPALSEIDFSFPTESFTGLFGAGAVIDGEGNLRIDSIDPDDAWALWATALNMTCDCKCPRDVAEINTITISVAISAEKTSNEGDPCFNWGPTGCSDTWVFSRIPFDQAFAPPAREFKLYTTVDTEGCCHVAFAISPSSVTTSTDTCPDMGPDPCVILADGVAIDFDYDDAGCTEGFSTSTGGTARIVVSGQGEVRNCDEPDPACEHAVCGHTIITGFIYPWTLEDFTPLIGSVHESEVQTGAHTTCNTDVTISIS